MRCAKIPARASLLYAATENGVARFVRRRRALAVAADSICRTPRCAISSSTTTISSSPRTAAVSGFSTTSSRCASWRAACGPFSGPHLFAPQRAYRVRRSTNTDTPLPPEEPTGKNPPDGAILDYALASPALSRRRSPFYDSAGRLVRRYSSDDAAAAADRASRQAGVLGAPVRASVDRRRHAPLRLGSARAATRGRLRRICRSPRCRTTRRACPQGPLVVPGRYTVRLDADGHTHERPLEVMMDPRVSISLVRAGAAVSSRPRNSPR